MPINNGREKEREKKYLYWLCHVPAFGAVAIGRLHKLYGSFEAIYHMEGRQLAKEGLVSHRAAESFQGYKSQLEPCWREFMDLPKRGVKFVTPLDQEYPQRLLHIYGYPMGLFVKGDLPREDMPAVAIIGARSCSQYGLQVASQLGRVLSQEGIQVISGLAYGIDSAGHRGALESGHKTYGVLGCGIHTCYPKENFPLYQAMAAQGGILTEFMPGEPPQPKHFPMRNRIISGLSDAILVVEAREKSGSLITVELGLEQGKEIFALPGRITDQLSAGCNQLIRSGANILSSPYDVTEYFHLKSDKMITVEENHHNILAKKEKMVYSCLDLQPKHLEEIVEESGLSVSECIGILLELELAGHVAQPYSQHYGKKR